MNLPVFILALFVAPASGSWRPPELEVAEPPPAQSFDDLQSIALGYLGRPYVWGGVGSPGVDCSGFTCRVFAEAGYAIPRVSRDQARTGMRVDLSRIAPGDLLFFAEDRGPVSHVGIYLGDGQMVHASSGQGAVVVDTLRRRWFSQNLVSARRVLTSTLTRGTDDLLRVTELSEHDGRFRLSPFVRRRAGEPDPALDPLFLGGGQTSVGVRSGLVTQGGRAGGVIAPELGLAWRKHAISIQLGLPIRFEPDGVRIGGVDDASDALRFVRELRAGVRGADLEIAFERERAYSIGGGRLVRSFAPLFAAPVIPGLATEGSALSAYTHVRIEGVEGQLLVDDIARPGVLGASAALHLPRGFGARVESAVDLRTADDRDLYGLHGTAFFQSPPDRVLQLAVDAGGGASGLGGDRAGVFDIESVLRLRFGDRDRNLIGIGARLGYAFDGGLAEPFGPTYPSGRQPVADAFGQAGGRPLGGALLLTRVGPVEASVRYQQALGGMSGPLDRTVDLAVRVADLPLAATRTLSLRAGYAARAPFDDDQRVDVAYARAELRLTSFIRLEGYLRRGGGWDGGTTLRLAWDW